MLCPNLTPTHIFLAWIQVTLRYIYICLGLWKANLRTGYGQLWDALCICIRDWMLSAMEDDQTTSAHMAEESLLKQQLEIPLTSLHSMSCWVRMVFQTYILHIYVVTVEWVGIMRCKVKLVHISTNARWGSCTTA